MKIIGKENEKNCMDVLSDEQIELLNKSIVLFDRHIYISQINYETGFVIIGIHHEKFDDDNFMQINVSCESVACLFWEVINAVFHRCM